MAANPSSAAATTPSKSNPSKKEKDTLIAVLQFLKKSKLSVSGGSTLSKQQTFFLKNADVYELESFWSALHNFIKVAWLLIELKA